MLFIADGPGLSGHSAVEEARDAYLCGGQYRDRTDQAPAGAGKGGEIAQPDDERMG